MWMEKLSYWLFIAGVEGCNFDCLITFSDYDAVSETVIPFE